MILECVACANEFMTTKVDMTHCPRCRRVAKEPRSRKRERGIYGLPFVGVDGEGVTRSDGTHDYVLLSVGDRSLSDNGNRLQWDSIFEFLYDCFEDDKVSAYVGFFLGYDFTHWFRTLPEHIAHSLLSKEGIAKRQRTKSGENRAPFPVRVGVWEIDILGMKRFKLRPRDAKDWLYVCDAGSFYQSSFLSAINPKGWDHPILSAEEYEVIRRGKAIRSDAVLDDKMVEYNVMENRVLSRLMGKLCDGFVSAGIELKRDQWYGPGQAAQAWLNGLGVASRLELEAAIPEYALDAARATYYGGWFEIMAHGKVPGVSYEYDINSAYPKAISELPDLIDGEWNRLELTEPLSYNLEQFERDVFPFQPYGESYVMVDAEYWGSDPNIGGMPHRDKDGRIYRPQHGRGWYWAHELAASMRAGLIDRLAVFEMVTYHPRRPEAKPFASIAQLYRKRLEVGKNSPSGKALKLMYNSAYGKMAQSIGAPKYASGIYASLITSHCRTAILESIGSHPARSDAVLMVATDGVYFDSPHPTLHVDATALGAWDGVEKRNLTLFMPGIYWDDDARERLANGDDPKLKSRGVNGADLAGQLIATDAAFDAFDGVGEWPHITVGIRFEMVTATQALARGKWETCGRITSPDVARVRGEEPPVKILDSDPKTKRLGIVGRRKGRLISAPFAEGEPLISHPYESRFGQELRDQRADMGISPDSMTFADDFMALLRGLE